MPDGRPAATGAQGDRLPQRIDPADWQASLDRMTAVFADIMATAAEVSTHRCPYKNRDDRCTASFGCRNQRRPPEAGGLRICAGDDRLDYRSAWEAGVEPPVFASDIRSGGPAGPPADRRGRHRVPGAPNRAPARGTRQETPGGVPQDPADLPPDGSSGG